MWITIIIIIFIIIVALILHDINRILRLQDELIKEHYVMRGELNTILDMASLGTSFLPKFSFSENTGFPDVSGFPDEAEDEKTTVEINT